MQQIIKPSEIELEYQLANHCEGGGIILSASLLLGVQRRLTADLITACPNIITQAENHLKALIMQRIYGDVRAFIKQASRQYKQDGCQFGTVISPEDSSVLKTLSALDDLLIAPRQ